MSATTPARHAPQLGDPHLKGYALVLGRSRTGKETFAECVATELVRPACLAGFTWSVVRPAREHEEARA